MEESYKMSTKEFFWFFIQRMFETIWKCWNSVHKMIVDYNFKNRMMPKFSNGIFQGEMGQSSWRWQPFFKIS
jgi:hypothetical protein